MKKAEPEAGTWTLTAPSGKVYRAVSPIKCCKAELDERVCAQEQIENFIHALYGTCEQCEEEFWPWEETYILGKGTPAELGPICGSCRYEILKDTD